MSPPTFKDSGRYASLHTVDSMKGPGDARPTAFQIIQDNDLVNKMKDKVMLVTGGSNGLGLEEVQALARTGARVFFTSRDMAKGEKVKAEMLKKGKEEGFSDLRIEILKMDLKSLESVRSAAEEFKSKSDNLHVLVNNAGIGMHAYGLTKEGHEQQFGVNHLAHFYLFQLLKEPLLKASTPSFNSRVVSVSSSIHVFGPVLLGDYSQEKREGGYDEIVAYASSKTANIWMANELDRKYGSKGLHSMSVHPGGIHTGFGEEQTPRVKEMIGGMIAQSEYIQKAFKSAEQGAASVVLAAVGKEYEGQGGFYMEDCSVSPPMPDDAELGAPGYKPWAYNESGEKQLWADSLDMLGLKDD